MLPQVSVLIPVHNAEKTLPFTLESCLNQSFQDFEILLCNDRSTDRSAEIIAEYCAKDPRFREITAPETSLVGAHRTLCAAAKSPLIARLDADDSMMPTRLEKQVTYLNTHPEISLCSSQVSTPNATRGFQQYLDWSNSLLSHDQLYRERFIESPLVHPSTMIRCEVLEAIGGYRETGWAEDYDLFLRFFDTGYRATKLEEVLLQWNDSPARLTRVDEHYSHKNFQRAKAHYLAKLPALQKKGASICGAGPTGKLMARLLQKEGIHIAHFCEVSKRRIGETICGAPVLGVEEWATTLKAQADEKPVLIGAVGRAGSVAANNNVEGASSKREEIRSLATSLHYREGEDFYCVA